MRVAIRFIAMLWVVATGAARAYERSDYERLRVNGQYAAAADVAQSRLDRSDLAPRERAEWCVEYIRARTEQALDTPLARRETVWRDAKQEAESFVERNPSNPAVVLVRVQAALALLARGELGREESRLLPEAEVSAKAINQDLSAAIAALDKAAANVRGELTALDQKKNTAQDGLSREELASLERHLRLELARGYRVLAGGYPAKSPEAIDAAQQAREQLEPLLSLAPASNLGWRARVEEARLLASERKYGEAMTLHDELSRAKLPAAAAATIEAEWLRILLAAGRVDEALALVRRTKSVAEMDDRTNLKLTRKPQGPSATSADLKIARLEAIVAAYRRDHSKSESGQAEALAKEIVAIVTEIGSVHGRSWRRRAELIATPVANDNAKLVEAASPELLALRSIREGKIDDAIAAYERAAAKAKQDTDLDRHFAATLEAARLDAGQGRREAAFSRCRKAALENPKHAQAATTHLWAIEYARQTLIANRADSGESAVEFHKLLAEHLQIWPGETGDVVGDFQKGFSE